MKATVTLTLTTAQVEALSRAVRVRSYQLKDVARERPGLASASLDTACQLDALSHLFDRATARSESVTKS